VKSKVAARARAVTPRALVTPNADVLAEEQLAVPSLAVAPPSPTLAEHTSTSSASLRAVEVPQPVIELPAEELTLPPAHQAASGEISDDTATELNTEAISAQAATNLAVPPRSAKKSNRVGIGVVASLAVAALVVFAARRPVVEAPAPASAAVEPSLPLPAAAANGPSASLSAPQESPVRAPAQTETTAVAAALPAVAPEVVQSAAVASPPVVATHNEKALEGALHWGITNAEGCHRGGRPVGTAVATLTFGAAGKVVRAELEGEPIASAPVSKCILSFLRSVMIPAFSGPEFTITREITLR
jgi:hypothetical protein